MKRVIISGYYGFNNFGDEAILYSLLEGLQRMDLPLEIVVLSADPCLTGRTYGVSARQRWPLSKVLQAMQGADYMITGGGSLLQDVTGFKSIPYYLGLTYFARRRGAKNILFAVGVGPIRRGWLGKLTKMFLNRLDYVSVRDSQSRDLLQRLAVQKEIHLLADPVFTLTPPHKESSKEILAGEGIDAKGPYIVIAPRTFPGAEEDPLIWVDIITNLQKKYEHNIILWPLHPQQDMSLCQSIAEKTYRVSILEASYSPLRILDLLKSVDLVLGVRYHALVLGAVAGCALLGVSYDPKVNSLLKQLGLPHELQLKSLAVEHVLAEVEVILNNPMREKEELKKRTLALANKALVGFNSLEKLLRGE